MKSIDAKELKELLVKCWMTHDAMWFMHSMQECGIEKTSKINKAAAHSVGMVEIKRIQQALSIEKVETFDNLKEIIEGVHELISAEFMDFTYGFPSENIIRWEMYDKCFAHDGIKKMGAIDRYQCGIFARIEGWFDGLELKYDVTPKVEGCMKLAGGDCFREYIFRF